MPDAEPALAGFTVESTALDNGAITSPSPQPKIISSSASKVAAGRIDRCNRQRQYHKTCNLDGSLDSDR
jgi:hypothetical protein